jgi:hypothetical protein
MHWNLEAKSKAEIPIDIAAFAISAAVLCNRFPILYYSIGGLIFG